MDFRLLDGKIPDFFWVLRSQTRHGTARREPSMSGKVGMSVLQTAFFRCQSLDLHVGDFFYGFYLRGLITKTMKQPPFGGGKGKIVLGHFFHPFAFFWVEEIGFQKEWTNPPVGWGVFGELVI